MNGYADALANIGIDNFLNRNLQDWQIQGPEAQAFISNLTPNVSSRMGRGRTVRARGLIDAVEEQEIPRLDANNIQHENGGNIASIPNHIDISAALRSLSVTSWNLLLEIGSSAGIRPSRA